MRAKILARKLQKKKLINGEIVETFLTITIDPATAQDFDDALSIQWLKTGEVDVGIHIADVTHYWIDGLGAKGCSLINRRLYADPTFWMEVLICNLPSNHHHLKPSSPPQDILIDNNFFS